MMMTMTKQHYRDYTAKLFRGARHLCDACPKSACRSELAPYHDCDRTCPAVRLRSLAGEMSESIRARTGGRTRPAQASARASSTASSVL